MGCSSSRNEDSERVKLPERSPQKLVNDIVTGSVKLRKAFEAYEKNIQRKASGQPNPQKLIKAYCVLRRTWSAMRLYHENCPKEINDYILRYEYYQLALTSFPEMDHCLVSIRHGVDGKSYRRLRDFVEIHVNAGIVAKKLPKNIFIPKMYPLALQS